MPNNIILLVEDSLDDEALTLRPLNEKNITNEVVVARHEAVGVMPIRGR